MVDTCWRVESLGAGWRVRRLVRRAGAFGDGLGWERGVGGRGRGMLGWWLGGGGRNVDGRETNCGKVLTKQSNGISVEKM